MTFNPDRLIATPGKPAETDPFEVAFGYGRRSVSLLCDIRSLATTRMLTLFSPFPSLLPLTAHAQAHNSRSPSCSSSPRPCSPCSISKRWSSTASSRSPRTPSAAASLCTFPFPFFPFTEPAPHVSLLNSNFCMIYRRPQPFKSVLKLRSSKAESLVRSLDLPEY